MARLEALSRGTLTRTNSRVVATRVPVETAKRIARFAAAHRVAPHVFVRQALTLLTAGPVASPDPEGILADLKTALGLPEHTAPSVVLDVLEELFKELGVVGDPFAASPEPAPAQLSSADLAAMPPPERQLALRRLAQLSIDGGAGLSSAELATMTPDDRGRYHIERDAARRARRATGNKR